MSSDAEFHPGWHALSLEKIRRDDRLAEPGNISIEKAPLSMDRLFGDPEELPLAREPARRDVGGVLERLFSASVGKPCLKLGGERR